MSGSRSTILIATDQQHRELVHSPTEDCVLSTIVCTGVEGDHMSLSARRGCVSEGVTTVLVVRTSPDVLWAPVTVPAEVVSPEVAVVGNT